MSLVRRSRRLDATDSPADFHYNRRSIVELVPSQPTTRPLTRVDICRDTSQCFIFPPKGPRIDCPQKRPATVGKASALFARSTVRHV